jgi:F0F1-type ATP synthase delta subunit
MIKSKQLAQALFELSQQKVDNLDAKFFDFLEKRNLKAQMPAVLYHLERIVKLDLEKNGIQIETAHAVSRETVDKIKSYLGKKVAEGGVDLSKKQEVLKIKKELVGGFRAKYDGIIYDSSITTGLKKLEELIISA